MRRGICILCFLVLFLGCKTRTVEVTQQRENLDRTEQTTTTRDTVVSVVRQEMDEQAMAAMLQELTSNLNIAYRGEGEADKLNVALRKTIDGLRMEISGKGEATYNETTLQHIEERHAAMLVQIDSAYQVQLTELNEISETLTRRLREKDREVKSRGWTVGGYILLALLAVLALVVLLWRFFRG